MIYSKKSRVRCRALQCCTLIAVLCLQLFALFMGALMLTGNPAAAQSTYTPVST